MVFGSLICDYFLIEGSKIEEDEGDYYRITLPANASLFRQNLCKYGGMQKMLFYAIRRSYRTGQFKGYSPESWFSIGHSKQEHTIPLEKISDKDPLSPYIVPLLDSMDKTPSKQVKIFSEKKYDGLCRFIANVGANLEIVADAELPLDALEKLLLPFTEDNDAGYWLWNAIQQLYIPKKQNRPHF